MHATAPVSLPLGAVHCGDNLPFMAALPDGCCDLVYIDPPFFTGRRRALSKSVERRPAASPHEPPDRAERPRGARRAAAAYDDTWPEGIGDYLAFLRPRLEQCRRLLPVHGTLYVHADWRAAHHVRIELDRLFGPSNFLNEIIWHYRTGGVSRRWFSRKHDTILAYARRRGRHVFHVMRDGAFRTDGLRLGADGRPYKSTRRGPIYFHPDGPALADVWDLPFLSTVSRERAGWPTQKPVALLERVIRASSDPGAVVGDFFCGSGTTLVAAGRLGRRWIGCDAAPAACAIARKRLRTLGPP